MKRLESSTAKLLIRSMTVAAFPLVSIALAEELAIEPTTKPNCGDSIQVVATVVPTLENALFHETKTSLKWWVVEGESGSVEDTSDGEIEPDDLLRLEHTANCVSTHQGEHLMEFCDAVMEGANIHLSLSGGMPAYASDLTIIISPNLKFQCSFSATYPAPTNTLRWWITKKELRLRSRDFTPGKRLYGWISVTFEEVDEASGQAKSFKIEGYIKPVILHKVE